MTQIERSSEPTLFFSKQETDAIVRAIQEAERLTSGEIRVHLEKKTDGDIVSQGKSLFEKIGMTKTAARNGVLIYLCVQSRRFAVLGDTGIHEKVPADFWAAIAAELTRHFKEDRFADGICAAVELIGEKLKAFFPYHRADLKELPDEISYS